MRKPMDDLEYRIARLALHPGDIVIVKVAGRLSDDASRRIVHHVKRCCGDRQRVLVVEDGIDLSILTAAEIEARAT
jgi:hypothetical protein